MLNSGAEGNFISHTFATKSNISLIRKNRPYPLRTVDGSASSYDKGWIRVETEPAKLTIGKHVEKITLDVTSILGHDIILGIPWFEAHEPHIKWKERTVAFPNKECAKHLATARRTPTDKSSQSQSQKSENQSQERQSRQSRNDPVDVKEISYAAVQRMRRRGEGVYTLYLKPSREIEQKIIARMRRGLYLKDNNIPKLVGGDCPQRTNQKHYGRPTRGKPILIGIAISEKTYGELGGIIRPNINKLAPIPELETVPQEF